MNKTFKKTVLAAAAILLVLSTFSACDMGLPWDVEVWGIWNGDNSALGVDDTVITVTNQTITIDNPSEWEWDYSGEVVSFDNDSYNAVSENPVSGDFGHLIFKITAHESDYGQDQIGKYSVIRWNELTDTGMKYSESGTQFDTAAEAAEAGADDFTYFSALTKAE